MLRIPGVERKPLIPRETIPPVNLSPPCDTRPDRMSETFALAVIRGNIPARAAADRPGSCPRAAR